MTTLASDNFNRADGALGGNWTNNNNSWVVNSNAAKPNTAAAFNTSTYTGAGAFPNDQWAQATVGNLATNAAPGPCIRRGAGGGYVFYKAYGGTGWVLDKFDGTGTNIGPLSSGGSGISNGDVLYIEAQGTTLICKVNGSQVVSFTDSTYSAGYPGLWTFSDAATETLDDFSAGDFAGGGRLIGGALINSPQTGVLVG